MTPHAEQTPDEPVDVDRPELEDYTAYEDDGAIVICDRKNPQAWIRSSTLTRIEP